MNWIPFLLFFCFSCSQFKQASEHKMVEVRFTDNDVVACQDYQKNVLETAMAQETGKVEFVRDLKVARLSLSTFDPGKGLVKEKSNLVQNILYQCDEELIKKFDRDSNRIKNCNLIVSELNYFQGLAVALKKYPWPTDLQLEGKRVALNYVTYFSEDHYPLISRLVALSVLDELSVNKIINEDLHGEIKQVMNDSQAFVEGLKGQLKKDPALSCESLSIIRDELKYSDQVALKIKNFLARI